MRQEFARRSEPRPAHRLEANVGTHEHVVQNAQIEEHATVLERARQPEGSDALGRESSDVAAGEDRAASVRRLKPRQEIEYSGFAGPVRPDDADELALANHQVEASHGPDPAEVSHQPGDFD
jgi:hypothetical protein